MIIKYFKNLFKKRSQEKALAELGKISSIYYEENPTELDKMMQDQGLEVVHTNQRIKDYKKILQEIKQDNARYAQLYAGNKKAYAEYESANTHPRYPADSRDPTAWLLYKSESAKYFQSLELALKPYQISSSDNLFNRHPRGAHIAYCLLRGTPYSKIEKKAFTKPDLGSIQGSLRTYFITAKVRWNEDESEIILTGFDYDV